MLVSTKGRYGLRVMLDLAKNKSGAFLSLKEIATRQEISKNYLEAVVLPLTKNGLIEAQHGKGGGYRLTRPADTYTAGEILRVLEGSLLPVACLCEEKNDCKRAAYCQTLPMWVELGKRINDYLDSVTLDTLADQPVNGDYVI